MHAAAKHHSIWLHWAISLRCRQKAKKRQASSLLAHIAKKLEPGENKQHYRSRNSHSLHFNRKEKIPSDYFSFRFIYFFFSVLALSLSVDLRPSMPMPFHFLDFFLFSAVCVCVLFCSYNTNTHAWHCRMSLRLYMLLLSSSRVNVVMSELQL